MLHSSDFLAATVTLTQERADGDRHAGPPRSQAAATLPHNATWLRIGSVGLLPSRAAQGKPEHLPRKTEQCCRCEHTFSGTG